MPNLKRAGLDEMTELIEVMEMKTRVNTEAGVCEEAERTVTPPMPESALPPPISPPGPRIDHKLTVSSISLLSPSPSYLLLLRF